MGTATILVCFLQNARIDVQKNILAYILGKEKMCMKRIFTVLLYKRSTTKTKIINKIKTSYQSHPNFNKKKIICILQKAFFALCVLFVI